MEINPERHTHDERTQRHDQKHRAGVTGIRLTETEAADGASGLQWQKSLKQLAFNAPRAAAP